MPFGELRPLRMVFTSRVPPRSTTAYTFFDRRLLTNTVPFSPRASERASGMPSAQTSTLKPGGTFSLSVGRSFAARPARFGANGCSVDSPIAGGLPCCQDGGGAAAGRSGERRGGEEGRSPGAPDHLKKKKKDHIVGPGVRSRRRTNAHMTLRSGCMLGLPINMKLSDVDPIMGVGCAFHLRAAVHNHLQG